MKLGSTTFPMTEERRAFLQQRVANLMLLMGSISAFFYVFRVALWVAYDLPAELLFEMHMNAHAAASLSLFAAWGINARGKRSAVVVKASEVAGLALACIFYGLMSRGIPQAGRPDHVLLLIFGTLMLARAIYIPSTWQRTVAIMALVGAELVAAVLYAFRDPDPSFVASLHGLGFGEMTAADVPTSVLLGVVPWWIALTALAASASAVVYGLRKEMAKAAQLGQYTLTRKIGEGGMGMVFEAQHGMLKRPTAIKLLQPEKVGEDSLARFEREVRATSQLRNPSTITVFDYGRTPDGLFYYAMELVHGATLTEIVGLDGPMPPERAIHVLRRICDALNEAHLAGLVHRDVKPDNVLLAAQGGDYDVVKVVDFGLVKEVEAKGVGVTHEGTIVGTPQFMPPEVIKGQRQPDARSDLYALGGLAFFLLTGEHAFVAESVIEVCSMHLSQEPDAPSKRLGQPLPDGLDALVLSLLAKEADGRPPSAAAVRDALSEIECDPPWTRERAQKWWRDFGDEVRAAHVGTDVRTDTRALAIDLGRRT